ncbi:Protein CBG27982 [Caenorhabditis briggsae]|uniref:Protein CBG27982 n=1 Tax=Caenorhabditis briggsae TaxID=6238 RepID=B6IJS4_CAEBR|nr:Protein CBG27982 [Caenorhabditis briggsae]CAS00154.1 Protein CBG27982 [Caenorhabditis briggsae]
MKSGQNHNSQNDSFRTSNCQHAEKQKSYMDPEYTNCLVEKIEQEEKCSTANVKKSRQISKFVNDFAR